jgi:hypothetical protein
MDVSENPDSSSLAPDPSPAKLDHVPGAAKKWEDKPVKRFLWFAMAPTLLFAGVAVAQYPVMDRIADEVVQKYQQSSCEQLRQEKA